MRISTILLCLMLSLAATAEDVNTVSRAALEAYQSGDWAAYLDNAKKLDSLRPDHPRVLYNLSGAYALNGEKKLAIETLGRVAAMGLVYPAAQDDDFAAIRGEAGFAEILARFAENGRQVGSATPAALIESVTGGVPEGVARDPQSGTMWVSLVRDRAIWKVGRLGAASKLDLPDDIWSVTGIQFHERSGTLWFCTAATPIMKNGSPDIVGRSAVVAWDAADSKIVGRWDLEDDAPHWLGDLIVTRAGTVFTTDSRTPAIYRIDPGSDRIEKWLTHADFVSLQGLALSRDGRTLFVADYAKGIWSVDVESREVTKLAVPPDATVLGIDGLYVHGDHLIGIQNGTVPHRVIRIRLDADATGVEAVDVLEANRPEFDEPTLGVVQGDTIWFVATSQWGSFTDDGRLRDGAEEKPVMVMMRKLE